MAIRFPSPVRAALLAFFVLAAPGATLATPWPKSDMPADPAVTFGELPNGMRYAIQHNATPSGEVSVRLRIAAGALQEEKDQRGLAHFLEHLAFRGSANVADGDVKRSLERIGLSFGSDTNASTGQEETIYQFDLPRSDDASVDTALNLLSEISTNLNLDPAIARTESGVVLSELKLRELPSFQAAQARLNFLFKDLRAAQLANGDAAVIAQASVQRIRDFYRAFYRPERATLIIVGDIDPVKTKDKITKVFSGWRGIGPAGSDPKLAIPLDRGLEVQTFDGKGVGNSVLLAWTTKPPVSPQTLAAEKDALIEDIALSVLNRRYRDMAQTPNRPFTRAGVGRGQDYQAVQMATLSIGYEPGQWRRALVEAEKMRLDILQNGVTQDELDRVLTEVRSGFEQRAKAAATRPSRGIVNAILSSLGENEIYTSAERDLATVDEDVKGLTVATVNKALRDAFAGGGALIFAAGEQPLEGGEAAVRAAFLEAQQAARRAPEQVAVKPWPYTNFGTPGRVVSTQGVADVGATYVRFANGVRLTVRPSQFSRNDIDVSVRIGDGRLGLPRDRATVAWAIGALTGGGLTDLTATEMQRSLTGRHYGAGFGMADDSFNLSGSTTPEDFDLQMQVLAAYVTQSAFRPDAFERSRTAYAERLRQAGTNPQAVMQLRLPEVLHGGDRRWASPTLEEVQAAKPEDLRALLQPVLEKGAIEIVIAGDTTVEKAVAAVAATFGALPQRAESRVALGAANATRFPDGGAPTVRLLTERPGQEIVAVAWPTHGRFPDIQDNVTLALMADIMSDRLFDKLRGNGTVYTAQAGSSSSKTFDYGYVQAVAQLQPQAAPVFHDTLAAIVADLQAGKVSEDELTRARTPAIEELRKARESNSYWLLVLEDTQQRPDKLDLARKYEAALKAVTLADIQAAARKYLSEPKALKLAVGPAS